MGTDELTRMDDLSNGRSKALLEYYDSILRTMFTLFMCICGGVDWHDAVEPLVGIDPVLGFIFCLYVAFAMFCVLNIITGIFIESANKMAMQDDDHILLEELETRKEWHADVMRLFKKVDRDGDQLLNWE